MIRPPRPALGFRAHLYALMVAVFAPAILLGSLAVWEAIRSYQLAFRTRLQDTAHALALALDSELDSHVAALLTLADSFPPVVSPEGLAAFQRQADRTGRGLGARGVALHRNDEDARTRPAGAAPAPGAAAGPGPDAAVERALSTRRPAVGNLQATPLSPEPAVSVVVPVVRDGEAVAAVAATVGPDRLSRALTRWRAAQGGYVGVSDAARVTVARSDSLSRGGVRGQPLALPAHWPGGAGDGGVHRVVAPDGTERVVALHGLSAAPGWAVVVAEPWGVYEAEWRAPFDTFVAAGSTSLLAGLLAAIWLARRLARPVARLAAEAGRVAASGLGGEEAPRGGPGPGGFAVAEYEALGAALARAEADLWGRRASERGALAALAESEARLRTLADNVPQGLTYQVVMGPRGEVGRFTRVSGDVERLHGLPAAAILADPLVLYGQIEPEHRVRIAQEKTQAVAEGRAFQTDFPFRAASGEARWARLNATPRPLPNGDILWDGVEVDITAAKVSEAALREAEERFRTLFAAAPFSIVILDPETFGVIAFNDRACADLGYTREEFARLTVMDIDALGDMEAIRRRARAHALRPGIQEFEARHRGKDGEVRDVLVRACGIVLGGREVAYTAHHDITERKAAEAALVAREAEYRAIFETSAAGMTEVDLRTGRYLRVNRRFCEIVGRAEAELTGGLGPNDVNHPDDRALPTSAAAAAASPDGRVEAERRFLRPDGTVVWARGSIAVSRRGADGRPTRAAAVIRDVTAEKQAAELQTLLMREVDHRARNALAVVQAMLRLAPAEGPEARRYAQTLAGRVAAMARAHTLLSRDRWAGAELRELAEVELAPYAGGAGDERVGLHGPPVLLVPEAAQPVGMVLHELATNAVKYGALSRPEGRVEVSWRPLAETGGLLVEWREGGGPALAAPPTRSGFGTRLVARTVRQLGGEAAMDWAAGGLRCSFTIPANRFQAVPAARTASAGAVAGAEPAREPAAARMLAGPVA